MERVAFIPLGMIHTSGNIVAYTATPDNLHPEPPFGNTETSDFFDINLRTFYAKVRNFCPKKSDVFIFRKTL